MIAASLFILVFIAILTILIIIHEAGHFFVAKAANVKVLEFGVGFPPRLFGLRKGETLYSINAIPLGGFVKMVGEEDPTEPRSLASKRLLVRFLVIVAGPLMNGIAALLLFTLLFMIPQDVVVGKVVIGQVQPNSPAEAAGVQAGDIIISADGHTLDNHADLGFRIRLKLGEEMTWVVQRGRQERIVTLTPRLNPPDGQGAAGITVSTEESRIESRSQPPWTAIGSGMRNMVDVVIITKNEFTKWLAGGRAPQVAGPIGMGQAFSEVAQQSGFQLKERIALVVNLAAVISLSLAVFNILPIPALDGGRLPFLLIELARRGKRVPPRLEGLVHLVGFAVLITLAILISTIDILRISNGQSLLGG